ncbi:HAMP domain-containing histidine kinase [Solitalea sp. MAHUQ-68]|uniref:histidine kinase n=1 Tax=Solitalea agri TaxID=2953739 RepID=A0A9X2F188_9SPHI|nr:HAMP domain-containing sensor histidine kinase [Solitalea agri]MCO4292829.1 HAMP domain-containing histidine kinase [Solitalea agri]
MKKKSFVLIVVAIGIGLIGLMAMQGYFLYDSYKVKSQLFDQTVKTVMQTVAAKLEKNEALGFIRTQAETPPVFTLAPPTKKHLKRTGKKKQYTEEIRVARTPAIANESYRLDSLTAHPKIFVFNQLEGNMLDGNMLDANDIKSIDKAPKIKVKRNKLNNRVIVRVGPNGEMDSTVIYFRHPNPMIVPDVQRDRQHEFMVERRFDLVEDEKEPKEDVLVSAWLDSVSRFKKRVEVFEKLAVEANWKKQSLLERVRPSNVDSLLKEGFNQARIDLNYQFSLVNDSSKTVFHSVSTKPNSQKTIKGTYQTALFPQDVLHSAGTLVVVFPNKSDFLWKKMGILILASSLIVLVIMACFAVVISALLRQKKLSEMKSDFINNMTHEFKTPVATIMLASEALRDEEMAADKKMINRYAGIIYDENLRLSSYVERVLSMARLEKSDLKLDQKQINMHNLIAAVADSMDLQFKRRTAILNFDLQATEYVITGDELHLSNVIFNLLDNALKYSEGTPEITISTQNLGNLLLIRVLDNGIGMTREQQSKVFDQFYRAHTGNLHNVKGFGLGLNYVYSIVKLLKGNISVKSEPQKGSTFELSFLIS